MKCEGNHCSNHEKVPTGSKVSSLPTGWVLACLAPDVFADPALMHFCSTSCAYRHENRIEREEKEALTLDQPEKETGE